MYSPKMAIVKGHENPALRGPRTETGVSRSRRENARELTPPNCTKMNEASSKFWMFFSTEAQDSTFFVVVKSVSLPFHLNGIVHP